MRRTTCYGRTHRLSLRTKCVDVLRCDGVRLDEGLPFPPGRAVSQWDRWIYPEIPVGAAPSQGVPFRGGQGETSALEGAIERGPG